MISPADARILDLNSAWHGVPTARLMENAGRAVADIVLSRDGAKRILILAGPGNNGGDGAVAARHLADAGRRVTVLYALASSLIKGGEARAAHAALDGRILRVETYRGSVRLRELLRDADLVIDALLGVGATGALREPMASIVRTVNALHRPVVAVDVPTGLGGRQVLRASVTVALHDRKPGMTRAACGAVRVRPIGIPPAASEVGPGDLAVAFPRREPDSHKGQNGRLLIVAGGPFTGAPILSALGALRTGCDLVHLYAPQETARVARVASPDLVVHAGRHPDRLVPADAPGISSRLSRVDAVLLGPGIGLHAETRALVEAVLADTQRRRQALVLDADALVVAGRRPELLRRRPVVATPHSREFLDLTRRDLPRALDARVRTVAREARRLRASLLVKGPIDIVSDGRRTKPNRIHHPWMTVGGTGDVLAGLVAGFVARGIEPFRAACAAAFLNGAAGLRAHATHGDVARATDLVNEVPCVVRDWASV